MGLLNVVADLFRGIFSHLRLYLQCSFGMRSVWTVVCPSISNRRKVSRNKTQEAVSVATDSDYIIGFICMCLLREMISKLTSFLNHMLGQDVVHVSVRVPLSAWYNEPHVCAVYKRYIDSPFPYHDLFIL